MKKVILIIISAALLVAPAACMTALDMPAWHSIAYADTPSDPSSNIMIVFYKTADGMYLFWTDINAVIIDNGDTWDIISAQVTATGVNKDVVSYDYYSYQAIVPTEFDENGEPLPIYMADLNLQPPTSDDLPKSQHIGVLTAVNPALARPATVTRKWHGVLYDVQCLADQDIVDMYQAGDLNVGDYVIVSFIDEIPNTTELNIAIITGKVYESWP